MKYIFNIRALMVNCYRGYFHDMRGNIALPFALSMFVLLMAVGAAIDFSRIELEHKHLLSALDNAALAAASMDDTNAKREEYGQKIFQANAINPCANEAVFTFNSDSVAVQSSCFIDTVLMGIFGKDTLKVGAQSVAAWAAGGGQKGCIYALDSGSTNKALEYKHMNNADMQDCVPVANSTHSSAIKISSLNNYYAGSLYTSGNYTAGSIGGFYLDEPAQTSMPPLPDPYADLADASDGITCSNTGYKSGSTYYPGTFCGGLNISGSATFMPGTYYIINGELKMSGIGTVSCNCAAIGSGVTFVMTGTTPSLVDKFTISSINTFDLRAPSDPSYDFPGILIYVDRDAPLQVSKFSQIDNVIANGAIYAASQELEFNSINAAGTECGQVIGYRVSFNSIDGFSRATNCSAYGAKNLSLGGKSEIRLTQ